MAKFSAILIAATALIAGTQAAATPRAETCDAGTIACGYDLTDKYGHTLDELKDITPDGLSPPDSLYVCGEKNTIESYVDTCTVGRCVGDHRRPGHEDAFCEA